MAVAIFQLPDEHKDLLVKVSRLTGRSMSDILRGTVAAFTPYYQEALSGNVVIGVNVETASGSMRLSRGF